MHGMVDPLVTPLFGVAVAFTKILLRSTNNNLGADIIGDTAEPLAAISQLVLGKKSSKKQLERAINRDLDTRMRNMNERCRREGIDPNRLANPCAEVEAVLNTIDDHEWILEQAVHDPDALRTYFQKHALKQRAQVDARLVPYFDELIEAVAEQYINYAERSPNYLRVAAKHSFKDNRETREKLDRLHDTVADVPHKVAELISSESKPSRVFFGSRPDVVAENRFVERSEQEHLNALITDPTKQRTVLVGMRGCGKTQLAAALAQECEDANWSLSAWVNASSSESITSDLVELAKELKKELKIDTSDQPTPETIIRRLFNRLKSADPSDRLIVFDNVENIDDLRGFVPRGNGLRVVATTTNNTGWGHQGWDTIKVGVFDRDESINYLLTVTKSDDHDIADVLAKRLGDLPLAIAQAAGTARNKDLSLARYLQRLDSRGEELVIRHNLGDEYTVDTVKALLMAVTDTIEGLEGNTKETAQRQLGALALLAESGVPTRWLDPTVEQLDDDASPNTQQDTDEDAHDALTELIHRSIVQQSTDGSTTMLHRLQAQVLRESWDKVEYAQARESAVSLLGAVDIDKFRRSDTESRRRETLDLIEALRAIGEQTYSRSLLSERSISTILKHTLPHAHYLGLDYEVLSLGATIALICEIFGYEHPDTISLRFHFAESCQSAGKIGDAITLYQEVLSTSQQVLGPSHQSTLAALNGLSCAYFSAGHLTVAIPMFEQVLSARIKVLGPDHPDTLRTRGNLAVALHNVGDLDNAIALQEQVVSESRRILGPHHTDAFTFAINLADTYHSARRLDDAIQYYEELSTEASNYLGYNHPITLTVLNNLASVYESAEMFDSAIALYEEVVALRTRFIGPNHIDTLTSRSNLAGGYESVGRLDEAIALYEQILQDSQHSLGPKHPETIGAKANLAHAYHIAHRISDALNLYEDALATSTDTLGAEHPDTLHVQHSLATVFESAGDLTTALGLYEQVFSERERLLSFEHPDTLITANDLANAYSSAGRSQEAIDLHERVFKTRVHLLDVDHPDTLTSGTYLAYAYLISGHVIEAISLYRELLDVAMDALGPEHTLTQTLHNHVTTLMTAMSTQGEALDEH